MSNLALGSFWRRFVDLLPKTPRLIGTVVSISDNRYVVQLTGGGMMQALGPTGYQVSDKVFVVDKRIEGKAPALTNLTIEV